MIIETKNDLYCTPPDLIEDLKAFGEMYWDACCNEQNCLAPIQQRLTNWHKYDYLKVDPHGYGDFVFMNPPYSKPEPFIIKAWQDSKKHRIVCLLRDDESTDWFNHPLEDPTYEHQPPHFNHINPEWSRKEFFQICRARIDKYKHELAIIHLRKRVKFYYNGEKSKSSGTFASCLMIMDRRYR